MAYYYRLGEVPPKRHTQFRKPDGGLYREELVSSRGFSGIYSNLYHIYQPTNVREVLPPEPYGVQIAQGQGLRQVHLKTAAVSVTGTDYLSARLPLLANEQVVLSICSPSERSMDYFYKNADGDELLFVHEGAGVMHTQFGELPFRQGDYIVVPRTVIYRMEFEEGPLRLMIVDSRSPIETVERYRNEVGQLLEHSPYCERDLHPPVRLSTEQGHAPTLVKIKKEGYLHPYRYDFSPLDVVGWDGYLYPYTFSIYDFEPITGRLHQPPPVHQTFQAEGAFVVCSFVPRLYDYHPQAIPAPYNHSNIDSDEVLYYVEGNFMSRRGIDKGSFTVHVGGLPHGPHPGTTEASIGAKGTEEYAVMVDTFRPLHLTQQALDFVDKEYPYSWRESV